MKHTYTADVFDSEEVLVASITAEAKDSSEFMKAVRKRAEGKGVGKKYAEVKIVGSSKMTKINL